MDIESYRAGKHVGFVQGSLMNGCRSMACTWPADAPDDAKDEVIEMAKFRGLVATFDGNGLVIDEPGPKRPDLHIVPSRSERQNERDA